MTCFTYGEHRIYEQMMKRIPFEIYSDEYDRYVVLHYKKFFNKFLEEYNFDSIRVRLEIAKKNMLFDDFIFLNENHRNTFYKNYNSYLKRHREDDIKIAIMYLLSVSCRFNQILTEIISNNMVILTGRNIECENMLEYTVYHAAKMLLHEDSEFKYSDIFDRGVLEDEVLCLIIHAMFISRYGANCSLECGPIKEKQGYIKNSARNADAVYFYGNGLVRVG